MSTSPATVHMLDLALASKLLEASKLRSRPRLLDIGCGEGDALIYFRDRYQLDCYGVDKVFSADTSKKLENYSINWQKAQADSLPYVEDFFDVIISECVFSLLTEVELADCLSECRRVLRTGGLLHISDVTDKDLLSMQRLVCLLEDNGYEISFAKEEREAMEQYAIQQVFDSGLESLRKGMCSGAETYFSLLASLPKRTSRP